LTWRTPSRPPNGATMVFCAMIAWVFWINALASSSCAWALSTSVCGPYLLAAIDLARHSVTCASRACAW